MCSRFRNLICCVLVVALAGSASAALPDGWVSQDVGDEGLAGSADYVDGTFTVNGSGHDIWDNSDDFHYCYTPVSGDTEISARVVSITNGTNEWRKAGVMIRESLAGESTHNMTVMTNPDNQPDGVVNHASSFQGRTTTGGGSVNNDYNPVGYTAMPWYVRLIRSGNNFTGSVSPDGVVWTDIATRATVMATEVYAVTRAGLLPEHPAVLLRDWLLTAEGQATVAKSGYVPYE